MGIPSLVCMWGPEGDGTVGFLAGWSPPAASGRGQLASPSAAVAGQFPSLCRVDVADVKILQEKAAHPFQTSSYGLYICCAQQF